MTVTERTNFIVDSTGINPVYAFRIASNFIKLNDDEFKSSVHAEIKNKPKPFVKWVGGKRQLLSQFRELGVYPPKEFNPLKNTYHEPFVGGGALFFDLLPVNANLNDFNAELITTYKVIRDEVSTLTFELNNTKYIYDKEMFLSIRALNTSELNDIERAARFIYLNRTAFNGMYRVNKSGGFNVPFGKYTNPQILDEENLLKVSKVLQGIAITNNSYKKVLDTAKSGDFIYFDPPYHPVNKTSSFTAYTNDGFMEKEQTELRDTYLELNNRGCFVMLSNSNTPFIESLFKPLEKESINIHTVQAGRVINSIAAKRGKVFEVLVTNY